MRKWFRSSSPGAGHAASTLEQHSADNGAGGNSDDNATSGETPAPLEIEEMLLELEFEKMAGKAKLDWVDEAPRRMSCLSTSDILRSARSALNQYPPRFSADGKDAMYRSFRDLPRISTGGRSSICCSSIGVEDEAGFLPIFAGENVVWCKPGVVAKLMGLEAIPVPVHSYCSWRGKMMRSMKLERRKLVNGDNNKRR